VAPELDRCQPSPHQILNTGYSYDAPHQILMQGRAVRGTPRPTPCHCSGRQGFGVGAPGRPPQPCGTAVPGRCPTAPPDPSSTQTRPPMQPPYRIVRPAGTALPKLTCTSICTRARELQPGVHHHHHAPRPRSVSQTPSFFSQSSSPTPHIINSRQAVLDCDRDAWRGTETTVSTSPSSRWGRPASVRARRGERGRTVSRRRHLQRV
jgi:hypothetical protein